MPKRQPANKVSDMRTRRALWKWIGCAALLYSGVTMASAQSLSSKPIRIVVPVAAGAATDTLARMAGDWLGKKTGLPIIMENRTGAGGNIALEQVTKGEPDGHTLMVATNGAIPSIRR